jgi:hypothetical protein
MKLSVSKVGIIYGPKTPGRFPNGLVNYLVKMEMMPKNLAEAIRLRWRNKSEKLDRVAGKETNPL